MAKQVSSGENIMGTEKISRLVITTGIPLMLSLLINSLYNLVDSVFVARISEDALTALSLAGPVQLIVSSLGLGNAVGLNAVISKALGAKNPEKVKKAANAGVITVPGAAFGANGQGHVRMSYANSYENIEKAMDILEERVVNG